MLFALNHQNYARWLVRYRDNLLKVSETHTEVYKDFQEACFAIKRTQNHFSVLSIDSTLEQTIINADATSQKTGITSLSNSIGARQRRARSHFLCTKIISYVFGKVGMSKKDVTQDLRPNQIKKISKHLQNITETLQEKMNPFSKSIGKESLFNIGSGKAALTQKLIFCGALYENV